MTLQQENWQRSLYYLSTNVSYLERKIDRLSDLLERILESLHNIEMEEE
jgi:hypothetical protein